MEINYTKPPAVGAQWGKPAQTILGKEITSYMVLSVLSLRVGIAGMVLYLGYILERRSQRNTSSLVQRSQAGGHCLHLWGREA